MNLVGRVYGSVIEFRGRTFVNVEGDVVPSLTEWLGDEGADEKVQMPTEDNRNLVDNNSAQKLESDEITKMKREGLSGSQIITALVKHSASFADKTLFSKQKYLRKKIKKFVKRFRVERADTRTLAEGLFEKDQRKMCSLRWDSLAQILSVVNILPSSKILVLDDACGGFVSAAVAKRMGTEGEGRVLSCHRKNIKVQNTKAFNFTSKENEVMLSFLYENIDALVDSEETSTSETATKRSQDRSKIRREIARTLQGGVDGLLIVVDGLNDDPIPLLTRTLPLLKPGGSFAVFCAFMEPLTECFLRLQEKPRSAIDVQLTETWMREIQVLPLRTHPTMNMHGHSGYILRGIRIDEASDVDPEYALRARDEAYRKFKASRERKRQEKRRKGNDTERSMTKKDECLAPEMKRARTEKKGDGDQAIVCPSTEQ